MLRKALVAACIGVAVVAGVVWLRVPAAADAFQHEADIVRLRHLEHYGSLIEEYRQKMGKVPLQGTADLPVYVHVANNEQIAFTKKGPPTPHKVVQMSDFVSELEAGLGRTIDEYYDPQYRPVNKPNFYIYMVHDDVYFFAVHVHQPYAFAKKVADHYHKVEISNAANELNGACDPALLFAAAEFKTERDKGVPSRLFALRDEKYLHFAKQHD